MGVWGGGGLFVTVEGIKEGERLCVPICVRQSLQQLLHQG